MSALKFSPKVRATKRGDTIIEVMFALAIFALVAIVAVMAMNLGLVESEASLESVTARNELNAQAEALRFIHSSYISEKTLPTYGALTDAQRTAGEKYQQYADLWNAIASHAITPEQAREYGILNVTETVTNNDTEGGVRPVGCERMYSTAGSSNGSLLSRSNAFVLNTRDLSSLRNGRVDVDVSYISASSQPNKFVEAELGARILFVNNNDSKNNSTTEFTDGGTLYNRVGLAEGIWVVAVKDNATDTKYYDFYIESCWYSPNTTTPTVLDTVIRLYNPEKMS